MIDQKKFKLTRIAPTPSGYLHLGNAFSFALTAAIAKITGAEILLRIDDLDRGRVDIAYVNDIFDTLNFLGIKWQHGPLNVEDYKTRWSQLCRFDIYQPALAKLAKGKRVFACTCSRSQLQTPGYVCACHSKNISLETPDVAWRLLTDGRPVTLHTLTHETVSATLPAEMKNFIVRKKDGYPSYQLSSLLDDSHFGVDLIVRGQDLLPSTIAQLYLASVLEIESFSQSTFHHHQLLTAGHAAKLSKSAGAASIQYMRAQGITTYAVYNQIGVNLQPMAEISDWTDLMHNI